MTSHKFTIILLLLISGAYAQSDNYVVKLEEDYTKPPSYMWEDGDEFQTNTIENGMYISRAARMHAQLDFPYSIYDYQKKCFYASDIEYTIVKVKGDKESFMCVQVDPLRDDAYPYLVFQYNEIGDWKLTNRNSDVVYKNGKAKINSGSNKVKIEHRLDAIHFTINDEKVIEHKLSNGVKLEWGDLKIYSKNKKLVIGLDKVVFIGYKDNVTFEKPAANITVAVEQPAPPDPNEVIDYNKVYEPQPDADIIHFRDKNEVWGAKNAKGEILYQPKFQSPPEFYDGVAFIYNGRAGLINRAGKELTPYQFYDFQKFSEGWAAVKVCDENGDNCKLSYIDKSGIEVLALPSKYGEHGSFFDGLAVVRDTTGNYGYIDKTGKEVIPAAFEDAGDFRYNRAPVALNDKIGYIRKTGQLVIPAKYYKLGEIRDYTFKEGVARLFTKEGFGGYNEKYRYGFIDVNGREFIPLQYSSAMHFVDGVTVVFNDKKYGYIDKTGKAITPVRYDGFSIHRNMFSEGLAMVSVDGICGFIDKTGKEIVPPAYRYATSFNEGLAGVLTCPGDYIDETCKWGFIDKTGKMVIAPKYSHIDEDMGFSEGLIVVSNCTGETYDLKCKYGFMDKTGKLVIPIKYDFADAFSGGLADVKLNDESFKVDKKGVEHKGGKNPFAED